MTYDFFFFFAALPQPKASYKKGEGRTNYDAVVYSVGTALVLVIILAFLRGFYRLKLDRKRSVIASIKPVIPLVSAKTHRPGVDKVLCPRRQSLRTFEILRTKTMNRILISYFLFRIHEEKKKRISFPMSNPRFQEPNSPVEKIKTPGPAKWVAQWKGHKAMIYSASGTIACFGQSSFKLQRVSIPFVRSKLAHCKRFSIGVTLKTYKYVNSLTSCCLATGILTENRGLSYSP